MTYKTKKISSQWELDDKQFAKATKDLEASVGKATGAMSVAVGNLATQGFNKLAESMGAVVRIGLDYEDWIGKANNAIGGMRSATQGLIDDLSLAKARTRLTTGEFQLNEKQLQAVAKATIHLTRINKTDFATSLRLVSDTIKKGNSRALKELGINVDLLGRAHVKTAKAVQLITERFGDQRIEAENTNERIDQLKNTFTSLVGQLGTAILQSNAFTGALKRITAAAREITEGLPLLGEQGRGEQIAVSDRRRAVQAMLSKGAASGFFSKVAAGYKGAGGVSGQISLADIYSLARKSYHELHKEKERLDAQFSANTVRRAESAAERRLQIELKNADRIAKGRALAAGSQRTAYSGMGRGGGRGRTVTEGHRDSIGGAAYDLERLGAGAFGETAGEEGMQGQDLSAASANWDTLTESISRQTGEMANLRLITMEADAAMVNMARGGLAEFTGATYDAMVASIVAGENIGAAVKKALADSLLGMGRQAAVKAIWHVAEGIGVLASTWGTGAPIAAKHFLAALKFGAVAVAAGVGGVALGGGSAAGGGSGMAAGRGASRGRGSTGSSSYRQSYSGSSSRDLPPMVVKATFGSTPDDPAALYMWREALKLSIEEYRKAP
ncbi:MAG: hypothetical protein GY835_23920 [bacterium]|nr:hypothetical protein [bacterium]